MLGALPPDLLARTILGILAASPATPNTRNAHLLGAGWRTGPRSSLVAGSKGQIIQKAHAFVLCANTTTLGGPQGRQHDIVVFPAFALFNPDDHTLAVDRRRLEADRLGNPQAGRVTYGQDHAAAWCTDRLMVLESPLA